MRRHEVVAASLLMASWVVLTAGAAGAQALPTQSDPAAVARQNRDTRDQVLEAPPTAGSETPALTPTPIAPPITLPKGGPTFLLKDVVFTPSALLPAADLEAIRQRYVGRQVDLSQLQDIANAVNLLYADRGFVTASAVLQPQDLNDGVLDVTLVEGRLGDVAVTGRKTLRASLLAPVVPPAGAVVDAPDLTRRIDRFNRTSLAQIQASLQAGKGFGQTDVALALREPPENSLQIYVDNQGVESVGEYEIGAYFQHYGLLGIDDRLSGYGLYAEGNLYGNVDYDLALSPYGTRLDLSASRSAIRIVNGAFTDLDITGETYLFSGALSQALYSDGPYFLQGSLGTSYSLSRSTQVGVQVSDDRIEKLNLGLTASYLGSSLTLQVTPNIAVTHADLGIAETELNYTLLNLQANASLLIDADTLAIARMNAQYSDADLVPGADLFQAGGPQSVRGYAQSTASGEKGVVGSVELYRSLSKFVEGLEVFGFVDAGTAFSNTIDQPTLVSAGAGLNYSWNGRMRAELSVGVPLHKDIDADVSDAVFYGRIVATVF